MTQPLDAVRSPGVVNEPYRVSMLAAGLVIAGIIGWIRNKRRR